jgi:hypothetical protein
LKASSTGSVLSVRGRANSAAALAKGARRPGSGSGRRIIIATAAAVETSAWTCWPMLIRNRVEEAATSVSTSATQACRPDMAAISSILAAASKTATTGPPTATNPRNAQNRRASVARSAGVPLASALAVGPTIRSATLQRSHDCVPR